MHIFPKIFFKIIYYLFYFLAALHGLSLAAGSGGYSLLRCVDFSLQQLLSLQSTAVGCMGFNSCDPCSLLSCSAESEVYVDQGSNLCRLHWQVDS